MTVRRRGAKFVLYSKKTGKRLGSHRSKRAAVRQERAIQISRARAAGHRIPKPKH